MMRLASLEVKELKDSLRYVEIQYAKSEKDARDANKRFYEAQGEIQSLHEQVAR